MCASGGRKNAPASGRRKRSVFWGFVLRIEGAKVKNIQNCSHKRICLARRHFRTLPWRAWPAAWALDVRFRGPKKRDCLWGKETHLRRRVGRQGTLALLGYARLAPSPRKSAWHGGMFGLFLGRLCLLLGLLMCASGDRNNVPASGGRNRTFIGEFCVKQHLLRAVDAVSAVLCLAQRHFLTLPWQL